jgi:hypothetical protein
MTSADKDALTTCGVVVGAIAVILAIAFGVNWYKAGVQQEVYRRQGCEMSRWEIMLGAKPIDRQLVQPK